MTKDAKRLANIKAMLVKMGASPEKIAAVLAKSAAPRPVAPKGDYYTSGRYDTES